MDSKTLIVTIACTLAGLVITVQVGLFVWLKSDIADLGTRVDRLEREVAFMRGQLSLAIPALAKTPPSQSAPPPAQTTP